MRPLDGSAKVRFWRQSLNEMRYQLSVPNSLGGSCRSSLVSLDSLDLMPRSMSLSSVLMGVGGGGGLLHPGEGGVTEEDETETVCGDGSDRSVGNEEEDGVWTPKTAF